MDTRGEAKAIIGKELEQLRRTIIAHHLAAGQRASGRTKQSLRVEFTEDSGTLYGRQAFGALETGRAGGGVPRTFAQTIRQWILDKGIPYKPYPYTRQPSENWTPKYTPEERGLISLSGAIAYKIRKEGTKLYREGGMVDIYSSEVPKTVQNILDGLFGILEKDVTHINLHSNEKDED